MQKKDEAQKVSQEEEWYVKVGWRLINHLLRRMEAMSIYRVRIQNFPEFEEIRRHMQNAELMIELFQKDTRSWRFEREEDGEIIAIKIM